MSKYSKNKVSLNPYSTYNYNLSNTVQSHSSRRDDNYSLAYLLTSYLDWENNRSISLYDYNFRRRKFNILKLLLSEQTDIQFYTAKQFAAFLNMSVKEFHSFFAGYNNIFVKFFKDNNNYSKQPLYDKYAMIVHILSVNIKKLSDYFKINKQELIDLFDKYKTNIEFFKQFK